MKMVKSLLLGSAAGLVAMAGAQAADLPVKAKPVQYVKICSLYGPGFFYVPGTDTCIKLGGFVRAEMNFNANGSFTQYHAINFDNRNSDREVTRTRGAFTIDARSQTEYGTLRAYALIAAMDTNSNANNTTGQSLGGSPYAFPYSNAAFIQFAGFTAGSTASFFDFDLQPYSNQTNIWSSNQAGNGIAVFAYTAQFGGGFSASVSVEDTSARRAESVGAGPAVTGLALVNPLTTGILGCGASGFACGDGYAGRRWPDLVGNLRVDQAWGSAQLMGALHDVNAGYYPVAAGGVHLPGPIGGPGPGEKVGFAIGGGLKLNAPMIGKGDYFITQLTYGEGAMNYVGSGLNGNFGIAETSGGVTTTARGPVFDATYAPAGGTLDLTKGWSITAGYEHFWVPNLKTSLYGAYGQLRYSADSSARIDSAPTGRGGYALGAGPHGSADWDLWQVGSRTVWTPAQNLDLSVEVIYNHLDTAFTGAASSDTKGWFAGMFRAQRNFWP